jgi:hypothetical protein
MGTHRSSFNARTRPIKRRSASTAAAKPFTANRVQPNWRHTEELSSVESVDRITARRQRLRLATLDDGRMPACTFGERHSCLFSNTIAKLPSQCSASVKATSFQIDQ